MTDGQTAKVVVRKGMGVGVVLALTISWSVNKSILWALFHAVCGWLYVLYYAASR